MAFESDDAPDASAERRKFVVDGSLKSIISGWEGSTLDSLVGLIDECSSVLIVDGTVIIAGAMALGGTFAAINGV